MKKIAIITGATAGIGEATAILLAKHNFNLVLTGRRKDRLDRLKKTIELESDSHVLTLDFDIRSKDETEAAVKKITGKGSKIDVLVNNAGLAVGLNEINEGVVDDWERMIDTNIKGLLYITRLISPIMVDQGFGHIVNISSIAGKETYQQGNVYCATKHAVQALTEGMRLDLLKHGIKVSSVCPGAVDTEFSLVRFKGDKNKAEDVYTGFTPLFADDIAETVLFVVNRPQHVNIDDILIMPTAQGFTRAINRNENN